MGSLFYAKRACIIGDELEGLTQSAVVELPPTGRLMFHRLH